MTGAMPYKSLIRASLLFIVFVVYRKARISTSTLYCAVSGGATGREDHAVTGGADVARGYAPGGAVAQAVRLREGEEKPYFLSVFRRYGCGLQRKDIWTLRAGLCNVTEFPSKYP